jgi:hypothetical protein
LDVSLKGVNGDIPASHTPAHDVTATVASFRTWRSSQLAVAGGPTGLPLKPLSERRHCVQTREPLQVPHRTKNRCRHDSEANGEANGGHACVPPLHSGHDNTAKEQGLNRPSAAPCARTSLPTSVGQYKTLAPHHSPKNRAHQAAPIAPHLPPAHAYPNALPAR